LSTEKFKKIVSDCIGIHRNFDAKIFEFFS